jgi:hypothetical protein
MSSFSKERLSWRARSVVSLVAAVTVAGVFVAVAPLANADAGNPILATIKGTITKTPTQQFPNAVTVYVRGQWNWLTHNSDCNFDRAATGVGIIWNDSHEPGYTVSKGTVSAGVGINGALKDPNDPFNAPDDQMVHPVDRGNQVEGYKVETTDYPTGQKFVDPGDNQNPNPNRYLEWRGGCGREKLTDTASKEQPGGGFNNEATGLSCATGGQECFKHPWGSWGYEKNDGPDTGQLGYWHTYENRTDVTSVCANFYDVHGGGTGDKFQKVNGAKEVTVNGNGDNSIQTNAFNVNQGANCIFFPLITTSATSGDVNADIHDTATISGAPANDSGTVTFTAWRNDNTCSLNSRYFTSTKAITLDAKGSGSVQSGSIPSPVPFGTYYWTANYDSKTTHIGSACGDDGETSILTTPPTQTLTGQKVIIHDVAHIDGFINGGGGTVDFYLYDDLASCQAESTNHIVYSKTGVVVDANGVATSGDFAVSPTVDTTYYWDVKFSGDDFNSSSKSLCTENFSVNGNDFDP